jgi:hypothetical protein
MLTDPVNYYFNILRFLKDPSESTTLDSNLKVISQADKTLVNNWFIKALDQPTFSTNDFKKLRNFLIDWISSFRTIVTTQKDSSNVWSLPMNQIYELFRSMGYDFPEAIIGEATTKAFFLDLVNLYKIKGSPEALVSIMEYHDVYNSDIIEYWLEKNENGNLVFIGKSSLRGQTSIETLPEKIVQYDTMVSDDPHWMMTEDEINTLISENKIALPSPSPYISVRSLLNLSLSNLTIAILRNKVEEQYYIWEEGGSLPIDIRLDVLDKFISFLELYAAIVYTYSRILDLV